VSSLPDPHVTPVAKTPFLDIVAKLNTAGMDKRMIPSKVEGVTFGQDIIVNGARKLMIWPELLRSSPERLSRAEARFNHAKLSPIAHSALPPHFA